MNFAEASLSVSPWARFRLANVVVKMHTLLGPRGSVPSLIYVLEGKCVDVHPLDGFYARRNEVAHPVQLARTFHHTDETDVLGRRGEELCVVGGA